MTIDPTTAALRKRTDEYERLRRENEELREKLSTAEAVRDDARKVAQARLEEMRNAQARPQDEQRFIWVERDMAEQALLEELGRLSRRFTKVQEERDLFAVELVARDVRERAVFKSDPQHIYTLAMNSILHEFDGADILTRDRVHTFLKYTLELEHEVKQLRVPPKSFADLAGDPRMREIIKESVAEKLAERPHPFAMSQLMPTAAIKDQIDYAHEAADVIRNLRAFCGSHIRTAAAELDKYGEAGSRKAFIEGEICQDVLGVLNRINEKNVGNE